MNKPMNRGARAASIAALALAAGLAGAAYGSSERARDSDTDRRAQPAATARTSSPHLAVDEILARLRRSGYTDFREVELEKGRYEVEGLDAEGHRIELDVDASTGEVLKTKRED